MHVYAVYHTQCRQSNYNFFLLGITYQATHKNKFWEQCVAYTQVN